MSAVTWLGLAAATLTTLSFLPQVLKVWRSRQAGDLSLATFGMLNAGVALWLAYGFLIQDLPIIVANGVTLVLVSSVLVLGIRFRRGRARPPQAS